VTDPPPQGIELAKRLGRTGRRHQSDDDHQRPARGSSPSVTPPHAFLEHSGITSVGRKVVAIWLPFGADLREALGLGKTSLGAREDAERLGMPRNASEWPGYLFTQGRACCGSAMCHTFAKPSIHRHKREVGGGSNGIRAPLDGKFPRGSAVTRRVRNRGKSSTKGPDKRIAPGRRDSARLNSHFTRGSRSARIVGRQILANHRGPLSPPLFLGIAGYLTRRLSRRCDWGEPPSVRAPC
jgi:hypothetical protein